MRSARSRSIRPISLRDSSSSITKAWPRTLNSCMNSPTRPARRSFPRVSVKSWTKSTPPGIGTRSRNEHIRRPLSWRTGGLRRRYSYESGEVDLRPHPGALLLGHQEIAQLGRDPDQVRLLDEESLGGTAH